MCISFDNHEVRPLQVAGRSKEYQTIFTQVTHCLSPYYVAALDAVGCYSVFIYLANL